MRPLLMPNCRVRGSRISKRTARLRAGALRRESLSKLTTGCLESSKTGRTRVLVVARPSLESSATRPVVRRRGLTHENCIMTFASFHLYVETASDRCEYDVADKLIVLHITDTGKVFLNQEQEDWNSLADRLSQIYSVREYRTLYLLADSGVPFQTIAHALDTVENAEASIQVRLITPKVFNAACPLGSGHPVLR